MKLTANRFRRRESGSVSVGKVCLSPLTDSRFLTFFSRGQQPEGRWAAAVARFGESQKTYGEELDVGVIGRVPSPSAGRASRGACRWLLTGFDRTDKLSDGGLSSVSFPAYFADARRGHLRPSLKGTRASGPRTVFIGIVPRRRDVRVPLSASLVSRLTGNSRRFDHRLGCRCWVAACSGFPTLLCRS